MNKRFALVLLAVLALVISAEAKRPVTPEDLFAIKDVGEAKLSPDGKWIVYAQSWTERAKNRSYTVDWTYLKLNGYWEETILCMDPFSAVNRRVEELLSQVSGARFYR